MATFDQLPPDQRAITELILRRRKSYEEISDTLGMTPGRVRDLAREALGALAPVTAERVDREWRGQVADYVLGQQTGPEAGATRGHLRSSEAARTWALSLLDSLEDLFPAGAPPVIPEGAHTGSRRSPKRASGPTGSAPGQPLSPAAQAVVRRRRLAAALAGALGLLVIGALLVGLIGGDDDKKKATPRTEARPQVVGTLGLKPTRGEKGEGIAVITSRGDKRTLLVQATRLSPSAQGAQGAQGRPGSAYEVWLYNSPRDARSLGALPTDAQGNFQGQSDLPADASKYRFVDISREPVDEDARHSGKSVLRGRVADLQAPQAGAQGQGGGGAAPQGAAPPQAPPAPPGGQAP